jgi:hypothetical protein
MKKLIALFFLFASTAFAQNAQRISWIAAPDGRAMSGQTISVCLYVSSSYTNGVYTGPVPCTPTVTLFADVLLAVPITPPFLTNSQGVYSYWVTPGNYTECVTGPNVTGICYALTLGGGGSGSGGTVTNLSGAFTAGQPIIASGITTADVKNGPINLAGGAPYVTGVLPVTNFCASTGASSTTFCRGDGTWASPPGTGTIVSVNGTNLGSLNLNGTAPSPDSGFLACSFKFSGSNTILECPFGNSSTTFLAGNGNALTTSAVAFTPPQCGGGTPLMTGMQANFTPNCTAAGSGPGTGTQFAVATWATTSTLGSINCQVSGQILTGVNGASPACGSVGIPPRINAGGTDTAPVCDSGTTTGDRAKRVIETNGTATAVTISDTSASGCTGNLPFTLIAGAAGTITATRSGSNTFTIINGNSVTTSATTFKLTSGQTAQLTGDNSSIWYVVENIGGTQTIASGTAALGTGAISSATCATVVTVSATGVAATDDIMADFNASPIAVTGYVPSASGMLTIIKYPTANNVNFLVCNNTSSSITPGAITLNWRVVR